eukprot:936059-Pleurochrysis_carterae.AAC.1
MRDAVSWPWTLRPDVTPPTDRLLIAKLPEAEMSAARMEETERVVSSIVPPMAENMLTRDPSALEA